MTKASLLKWVARADKLVVAGRWREVLKELQAMSKARMNLSMRYFDEQHATTFERFLSETGFTRPGRPAPEQPRP